MANKPPLPKYLEDYLKMEGVGPPGGKTRLDQLREMDEAIAKRGLDTRLRCSFCNKPQDEVRLICGPSDNICSECVDRFLAAAKKGHTLNCNFCGTTAGEVQKMMGGPTVFICDGCVELSKDIFAEQIAEASRQPPS